MSRQTNPETASVEDLVALFTGVAIKQNAALENIRTSEYNRLYGIMEEIVAQLKSRHGDQRSALLPLYRHPNPTVRFKAAMATLFLRLVKQGKSFS